jgi:hypothetical protein
MPSDFSFIWTKDGVQAYGPQTSDGWRFPIAFAGTTSDPVTFLLTTSALAAQNYETAYNLSFYLIGDASDVDLVQNQWPAQNAGLDISFDRGQSWMRFSSTAGLLSNPATWLLLPMKATGHATQDGVLDPFDTAQLMLRFVVPPQWTGTRLLSLQLGIDCDIV